MLQLGSRVLMTAYSEDNYGVMTEWEEDNEDGDKFARVRWEIPDLDYCYPGCDYTIECINDLEEAGLRHGSDLVTPPGQCRAMNCL